MSLTRAAQDGAVRHSMDERPLVSIIIPCYNHVEYLGEAIDSALNQTYRWREILVVNDGSPATAALRRVVDRYGPRIAYLEEPHRGLPAARNRGLDATSGTFVVFLDADDRLLPNALAAGVAALEDDPARGMVWGGRRNIDAEGQPRVAQPGPIALPNTCASLLVANIVGPPVVAMFRRTAVDAVGRFDPAADYVEDHDLAIRIARRFPIFRHDELVAEYRLHPGNRSGQQQRMYRAARRLLRRHRPLVRGEPELERARRAGFAAAREQFVWEPNLGGFHAALRMRRWYVAVRHAGLLGSHYPLRFTAHLIGRTMYRLRQPRV